jgi:hypothetical protein
MKLYVTKCCYGSAKSMQDLMNYDGKLWCAMALGRGPLMAMFGCPRHCGSGSRVSGMSSGSCAAPLAPTGSYEPRRQHARPEHSVRTQRVSPSPNATATAMPAAPNHQAGHGLSASRRRLPHRCSHRCSHRHLRQLSAMSRMLRAARAVTDVAYELLARVQSVTWSQVEPSTRMPSCRHLHTRLCQAKSSTGHSTGQLHAQPVCQRQQVAGGPPAQGQPAGSGAARPPRGTCAGAASREHACKGMQQSQRTPAVTMYTALLAAHSLLACTQCIESHSLLPFMQQLLPCKPALCKHDPPAPCRAAPW